MSDEVPVIETDRFTLRGHRLDDLNDCVAMWADPIVTRFIGGKPSTEQQTWARLLAYVGHWRLMGFGYWAVEQKATGSFVGELGFANFRRDISQSMKDVPELGWALVSRVHGRGYATEAVRGVIEWGDIHLPSERTICLISPENVASIRVAEKCGYREIERKLYNERQIVFFARQCVGPHPSDSVSGLES